MKLQSINTFVVGNPPPRRGGAYFVFVKLTTTCGITVSIRGRPQGCSN